MRSLCMRIACVCSLLALLAVPASAQIVPAGSDVWATATGSISDFSTNPLPAGFFCPGSAPFNGIIQWVGEPLQTNPPGVAGNADTVIARLATVDLSSGMATVPVKVKALSMRSLNTLFITCGDGTTSRWIVRACLCGCDCNGDEGQAETSLKLTLTDPDCECGVADGDLKLRVCLRFINQDTGEVRGPVSQDVHLAVTNMPFCLNPAPGSVFPREPFEVDTNCDGSVDCFMPGTQRFFGGVICGQGTCIPPEPSCHSSFGQADHDHCVEPTCEKRN